MKSNLIPAVLLANAVLGIFEPLQIGAAVGSYCLAGSGHLLQCSSAASCIDKNENTPCEFGSSRFDCICVQNVTVGSYCGGSNAYRRDQRKKHHLPCSNGALCLHKEKNTLCEDNSWYSDCKCKPKCTIDNKCSSEEESCRTPNNEECPHDSKPGACRCVKRVAVGRDCGGSNNYYGGQRKHHLPCASDASCLDYDENVDCKLGSSLSSCRCVKHVAVGSDCGGKDGYYGGQRKHHLPCARGASCLKEANFAPCEPGSSLDSCKCVSRCTSDNHTCKSGESCLTLIKNDECRSDSTGNDLCRCVKHRDYGDECNELPRCKDGYGCFEKDSFRPCDYNQTVCACNLIQKDPTTAESLSKKAALGIFLPLGILVLAMLCLILDYSLRKCRPKKLPQAPPTPPVGAAQDEAPPGTMDI